MITIPCEDPQAWLTQAQALLEAGALTAKKTGKQGHRKVEKEIALAPLILRYALRTDGLRALLDCTLAAGSEANLNPALLAGALGAPTAEITRVRLLRADGAAWE